MQPYRRKSGRLNGSARFHRAGSARKGDDREFRQIVQGQPPACRARARARHKAYGIIAQRPVVDHRRRQRPEHEGEFDFLCEQPGSQIRGDVDLDFEREVRVGVVDALDQLRQPGVDDGFGDASRSTPRIAERSPTTASISERCPISFSA